MHPGFDPPVKNPDYREFGGLNIFVLFVFFVVEKQGILPRRTRRARRTTDLKLISTSKWVAARQVDSGCLDGGDRYRPDIGDGGNGKSDGRNREIAIEIVVVVRFAFRIAQGVRRAVYPGTGKSVRPRIDPAETVAVAAGRPRISVQVVRDGLIGRIETGIEDRRCRCSETMDKGGKRRGGIDVVRFRHPCRNAVVLQVVGCHIGIDGEAAIRCFAIGRIGMAPETIAPPQTIAGAGVVFEAVACFGCNADQPTPSFRPQLALDPESKRQI